jgi:hypothetical protein
MKIHLLISFFLIILINYYIIIYITNKLVTSNYAEYKKKKLQ